MVVVNDYSVSSRQLSFVFRARLWIKNFNDTRNFFFPFPPQASAEITFQLCALIRFSSTYATDLVGVISFIPFY